MIQIIVSTKATPNNKELIISSKYKNKKSSMIRKCKKFYQSTLRLSTKILLKIYC
jgi:hypothetical protein